MMFARGDRYDRIDVALAPSAGAGPMLETVAGVVGDRGRVEKPEGRSNRLSAIIGPFEIGIRAAGFIALIVGMFLIYNAVSIAVVQRRREIGILRALGVPRRQLISLFAVEAILLGFLGSVLGLGLAQLIAEGSLAQAAPNVSQFYRPIQPPPPRITWELAIMGVAGGVLTTLLAALGPAVSASRVDPVATLRRSRGTAGMRSLPAWRMLAAAVVFAAGSFVFSLRGSADLLPGFISMVLLVVSAVLALPAFVLAARRTLVRPIEALFGVPGRLAVDNIERSLGRSVLTVAALMVAVGCSITAGTWGESLEKSMLAWLDQAVPADILVTAGSPFADQHNIPFKTEMMAKLEGIDGVEALQPGRMINQDLGHLRLQLLSLDSRAYHNQIRKKGRALEVVQGEPIGIDDLAVAPRIVVSENAANRLGLHPGEMVTFATPTGARKFEVRAVIIDYSSDQGFAYIDRKFFREWWEDDLVDTMDLYLEEGASVEGVVAEVRRRLGHDASLFVTPAAELREEIEKVLLQSLAVLRSSDFVTLIVAILGVIGTMLAAVIDRIREIGVLRAVGATRGQVGASIVAESAFIGVASVVSGTIFGVPLGMIFVHVITLASTGWRVDYSFPMILALQLGAAVVGTSALAGLLPGRHAAGLDVTDALAYE
jgi:putative ABC transport system permease protein